MNMNMLAVSTCVWVCAVVSVVCPVPVPVITQRFVKTLSVTDSDAALSRPSGLFRKAGPCNEPR